MASSNPSSTLLVGQALYFFNQNKLDESLLQWQKVIELDPNHKLAKEYIEKINTIQSRHTGNVTEYYSPETSQRAKILSIQQLMSREAENLAFSYIDKQIYDEAIAIWREMLKRNPEDTKINAYLALTFLKAGKYDQSLLQWQKILSYDPENVQAQAYEKLLSESTYEDLDNVARTLAMPRPQTSLLGEISDQQPAFIFEGLESSTIINTYITNGHVAKKDENTFHVGEKLKIKNRLYGDPLNIVVANDLYRSHGDTLNNVTTGSGVGSVEDGDYELFDRPRQATVQYYGKELQLLVVDIHSHYLFSKNPSHFVYQGIDYRGINLLYEKEKFRTKLMWGYMPFYEPRTSFSGAKRGSNQGTLNRLIGTRKRILFDRDYLYPREILGIDFRYELHPRYVIGAIFTKTEDHSHIKDISTFLPYTDNYLVSFTQSINFFPGKRIEDVTPKPEYVKGKHKENAARFFSYLKETFKWHVFQEFAYAWTDLDFDKSIPLYSNADLTTRSQNFDDWAIYTFSEMSLPKFHNQTLHQRIGPEFRNPQGFTYAQTVTYDRDYISSKSYYYPLDNFNVALNVSQLKSDLDKDLLIAEKDWRSAKLNVRWLPGGIWPNVTLGGKYDNYRSPDTSIYVANDWEMWAYTFGLNKEILGWDIFSNYKMTINDDDQDNFEKTFVNHFSVEAFKTIFPGIDLIFGHFFTEQDVNAPIPANFFDRDYNHTDITLNFDLWDTSYMSLLYSYLEDIDNFDTETVPEKAKVNSFSFTFGWPLYIRPDQEKDQYLDITPFFTVLVN
ncbi:hypothetical protein KDK77_08830, partial [bacterium]|nr:hypothetical protein [bacterium]